MLEIDLRKMKTFEAVARLRSFTAAAEELLIAQPSVSQHVQKLEESIGVPLLLRTRQGVELTDAGNIFLQEYYQTQARFERALRAARTGSASPQILRIGSSYQATARFLPGLLDRYKALYPRVQVQMLERRPSTIRKAVESGELEIGFGRSVGSSDPGSLEASEVRFHSPAMEVVYTDGLVVAAATSHPLSQESWTSLEVAAKYEWSIFDRSQTPEFCDFLAHQCRVRAAVPDIVAYWETFHTLMTMVALGPSISILPACFAVQPFPGVVFVPILPRIDFELVMFWDSSRQCTATQAFVELIRSERQAIQQSQSLLQPALGAESRNLSSS